jgi:hypothetical protein
MIMNRSPQAAAEEALGWQALLGLGRRSWSLREVVEGLT